jgi:hypothetical protein
VNAQITINHQLNARRGNTHKTKKPPTSSPNKSKVSKATCFSVSNQLLLLPHSCRKAQNLTKMCKYSLLQYVTCGCKYWTLSTPCSKMQGTNSGCPLFPYPMPLQPDEVKEGRCEFCKEDEQETKESGGGWFLG